MLIVTTSDVFLIKILFQTNVLCMLGWTSITSWIEIMTVEDLPVEELPGVSEHWVDHCAMRSICCLVKEKKNPDFSCLNSVSTLLTLIQSIPYPVWCHLTCTFHAMPDACLGMASRYYVSIAYSFIIWR